MEAQRSKFSICLVSLRVLRRARAEGGRSFQLRRCVHYLAISKFTCTEAIQDKRYGIDGT